MNKVETIVAIIPARYYSTRLPSKPLIDICGRPMIQHVYERAKLSKYINRVIVATDHEQIVEAVEKFGGEVTLTSPEIKSGSDRVAVVAKSLNNAEIIVNIQGDEPLIKPDAIDEAIQPLIQDSSIQVGTLIKKIETVEELLNPSIPKVILDNQNFAIYFSRTPIPYLRDETDTSNWITKHVYYKHIGLYVFRRNFLLEYASWEKTNLEQAEKLEQLRILEHGYKIKATITESSSFSIDTPEDVAYVRKLFKQCDK